MAYVMKNKIPQILKERGLKISDLHALILTRTEQRISYQSLHELAREEAINISDGVRIGSLKMIAVALGVTFDDLIDIEAA